MIKRSVFYFSLSIGVCLLSIRYGHTFKYEDYKDYLMLISGVSGMVFTIMGIWIAFLYPNAMARIVTPDKIVVADFSESKSDSRRLESIVGAVMCSAMVMMLVLLIMFAKLAIFKTSLYASYKAEFRAAAIGALVLMTFFQVESVLRVVLSNIMFINDLHFKRQNRQADEDI